MLLVLLILEICVAIEGRMDMLLKIVGKRMAIQVIFHRIEEEEIELFMVMVEAQMLIEAAKCAITVVSLATLRHNASRNMDIHLKGFPLIVFMNHKR